MTDKWGGLEKNLLRDMEDLPYESYLYCFRDSLIDHKAKELGLNTLYCSKGSIDTILDFQIYLELKNLINEKKFNFINCFHFKVLWILCFILRKNQSASLFFTTGKAFRKEFRKPPYRFLSSRIDRIFVPTDEHRKSILRNIKILSSKVVCVGMGVEQGLIKKESSESHKCVSLYVAPHEDKPKKFNVIFRALSSMFYLDSSLYESLKIIFVTGKAWENHVLYKELQELSMIYGLENLIAYEARLDDEYVDRSQIWIDLGNEKVSNPLLLEVFLAGADLLVPRKPIVYDFLRNSPGAVETFKEGDPRDLRDKLLKLLKSKRRGTKSYKEYLEKIKMKHSWEQYKSTMRNNYEFALGVQQKDSSIQ